MSVWLAYAAIFGVMAVLVFWEAWTEQAAVFRSRAARWPANIALAVINAGLAMFAPLSAVSAALFAQQMGWGLLHWVQMPLLVDVGLSLAVLTLTTYGIHRLFHQVPVLWRLHRIHHSDTQIDSTTAVRHHPVEVILTAAITFLVVVSIGVDPSTALALSLVDQLWAVWTHSALRLPLWLHRKVCFVFVTPLTHVIHHSTDVRETDTNYGNTVTIWDWLFGTHRVEPLRDASEFETGLEYSEKDSADLDFLLRLPFKKA
jgi:sterol desaturase/sphingolipid hydroxylase (fatty acid hydroxylase superfamily)